jgi:lincosamide nucleotidyltransferase A/C/D/E
VGEDDVLSVVHCLQERGLELRLDGGWGVDALFGRQTRKHGDLDLVVAQADVNPAEQALHSLGYGHDASADPGLPARFVLVDEGGHQVDLHIVLFDEVRNGWQPLPESAWATTPLRA